ncbi:hypothetical protein OEV82_14515 [Caldibacillus thermolactis]|jgi:hypothetical protein|uniref:DUF4083 domain-containing protein n=1 Tax=Pallidibacillus thermolactis TaxID=251051 RepID=A0ABT2WIX2_9BACI|nr:hypothetical protein [Pallidibacillus thermolactis]MCU9595642.1 hypothetical protein [Pallidibacillus thermolactis]MED1672835.1 hypothetical protein [Pallidibacillus thermolactis subsp. kokeshiiformis]
MVESIVLGDVIFQFFIFLIFVSIIWLIISIVKQGKTRKVQLDNIEKKLNMIMEKLKNNQ